MISGHKTAISSECWAIQVPPPHPGLPNSSRVAATVADNGFHSEIAPSQPGIVSGATRVFERKRTGHTRI